MIHNYGRNRSKTSLVHSMAFLKHTNKNNSYKNGCDFWMRVDVREKQTKRFTDIHYKCIKFKEFWTILYSESSEMEKFAADTHRRMKTVTLKPRIVQTINNSLTVAVNFWFFSKLYTKFNEIPLIELNEKKKIINAQRLSLSYSFKKLLYPNIHFSFLMDTRTMNNGRSYSYH